MGGGAELEYYDDFKLRSRSHIKYYQTYWYIDSSAILDLC